nr:MAG TPA: hypothetical protein [Caudoviricetes sp.]
MVKSLPYSNRHFLIPSYPPLHLQNENLRFYFLL